MAHGLAIKVIMDIMPKVGKVDSETSAYGGTIAQNWTVILAVQL